MKQILFKNGPPHSVVKNFFFLLLAVSEVTGKPSLFKKLNTKVFNQVFILFRNSYNVQESGMHT